MSIASYLDIDRYLELMVENHATDVFFIPNSLVRMKLKGKLISAGKHVVTPEMTKATAHRLMNENQRKQFEHEMEMDFCINSAKTGARFRVNAYRQQGSVAMVMRYVRPQVPNIKELNLPDILKEVILKRAGLILVAGGMGVGKSTTIAAMLDHRNREMPGHILCIEDPIEFIHKPVKSIFSQRELGVDTHSHELAIRGAMRESPDVVMMGEVRDQKTMQSLMEMGNTGVLAISTLHARNTYQALQRVLSLFPAERHGDLCLDLSMSLVCVVSQRLVLTKENKILPALEVMLNNSVVADLILQGKLDQLKNAITNSSTPGMQLYEDTLLKMYKNGTISLEEALNKADSSVDMERRLNFG
ncbi:PilT/PilU family type 4a pilus ATPase [Candidatus Venteria ishoeyi]|uniref:PilT/PilU family type 4a pilus ATPase n=1 Tax=Candidatus Venteria ishoeyi TaxID=1899563 RepID=UPI0025A67D3E|nr:PilT/PilU family type 4a pilus ATPase [Candidatus Venteria ishoeyi]MDM8548351.1 PilT/PilU family type 4a pilus ATPase [Candidatus Venteria ishoeyi]